MKVAIPTDDQITITKRTGQSKGFMVYEVENNKIINSEYRENTQEEHDEEKEHSHAKIIELLNDVNIFLIAAIGKHLKKDVDNSSLTYQIVQETELNEIINNYLKSQTMDKVKTEQVLDAIAQVMHPAINLSLSQLGIIKNVDVTDNKIDVLFAFPFPNIPIADQLINSVKQPATKYGYEFNFQVVIMTEEERQQFLQLEASAWKGM